jgi:hypothetical protein
MDRADASADTHDEVDEVALQEAPLFSLSGFVKIDRYAGQARG